MTPSQRKRAKARKKAADQVVAEGYKTIRDAGFRVIDADKLKARQELTRRILGGEDDQ